MTDFSNLFGLELSSILAATAHTVSHSSNSSACATNQVGGNLGLGDTFNNFSSSVKVSDLPMVDWRAFPSENGASNLESLASIDKQRNSQNYQLQRLRSFQQQQQQQQQQKQLQEQQFALLRHQLSSLNAETPPYSRAVSADLEYSSTAVNKFNPAQDFEVLALAQQQKATQQLATALQLQHAAQLLQLQRVAGVSRSFSSEQLSTKSDAQSVFSASNMNANCSRALNTSSSFGHNAGGNTNLGTGNGSAVLTNNVNLHLNGGIVSTNGSGGGGHAGSRGNGRQGTRAEGRSRRAPSAKAPHWAGSDWNPKLAAATTVSLNSTTGTGVFLPHFSTSPPSSRSVSSGGALTSSSSSSGGVTGSAGSDAGLSSSKSLAITVGCTASMSAGLTAYLKSSSSGLDCSPLASPNSTGSSVVGASSGTVAETGEASFDSPVSLYSAGAANEDSKQPGSPLSVTNGAAPVKLTGYRRIPHPNLSQEQGSVNVGSPSLASLPSLGVPTANSFSVSPHFGSNSGGLNANANHINIGSNIHPSSQSAFGLPVAPFAPLPGAGNGNNGGNGSFGYPAAMGNSLNLPKNGSPSAANAVAAAASNGPLFGSNASYLAASSAPRLPSDLFLQPGSNAIFGHTGRGAASPSLGRASPSPRLAPSPPPAAPFSPSLSSTSSMAMGSGVDSLFGSFFSGTCGPSSSYSRDSSFRSGLSSMTDRSVHYYSGDLNSQSLNARCLSQLQGAATGKTSPQGAFTSGLRPASAASVVGNGNGNVSSNLNCNGSDNGGMSAAQANMLLHMQSQQQSCRSDREFAPCSSKSLDFSSSPSLLDIGVLCAGESFSRSSTWDFEQRERSVHNVSGVESSAAATAAANALFTSSYKLFPTRTLCMPPQSGVDSCRWGCLGQGGLEDSDFAALAADLADFLGRSSD